MVAKRKLPIRWDDQAVFALKDIYNYIKSDSVISADYVKGTLLKLVGKINSFPEKNRKEPFLENEPGNYRLICKWHYKIIYEITENEIIIIDIFHTSQNPEKIKL